MDIFSLSRKVIQDIQFAFLNSDLEDNWEVVYATATESVGASKRCNAKIWY